MDLSKWAKKTCALRETSKTLAPVHPDKCAPLATILVCARRLIGPAQREEQADLAHGAKPTQRTHVCIYTTPGAPCLLSSASQLLVSPSSSQCTL